MKKTVQSLFLALVTAVSMQAQQLPPCGMDLSQSAIVKQRMLDNRANIRPDQLAALENRRTITWIPLTVKVIGDNNGNGYTSETQVYAMLCDLNNDYATQDIQFYLNSPISYLNSQTIHNDAFAGNAQFAMRNNKVANTLNIFVGQSVNNPTASFYSPSGDFVFMLNAQVSGTTSTCSHEVGHFFTLPHTFFGWENIDYQATYNGNNAPTSVNGRAVEYKARSGANANCQTAGDGFCGTPADYYYSRENCPYAAQGLTARDPAGEIIAPSDSNVMSYFAYGCRNHFSNDQRTAILSSIVFRNWTNFSAPASTSTTIDGSQFSPQSPANNQTIAASGGLVNLSWNAIPGATAYYIEIYGTVAGLFPNTNNPIAKLTVSGTNYSIAVSNLNFGSRYAWRVKPLNSYYMCAPISTYYFFTFGQPTGIEDPSSAEDVLMQVFPNPSNTGQITVKVGARAATEGQFTLVAMDGRVQQQYPLEQLQSGENSFVLDTYSLPTGAYILSLETATGVYHQKILLQ